MKTNERQIQNLTLKCECIVAKNSMQVNTKKKSKFSTLTLSPTTKTITVQPYGQAKESEVLTFELGRLRSVHHRYIEEGKITL